MQMNRFILTLGLFLIGGLHTMIFAIFQLPGNFLLGRESQNLNFYCKILLYFCAVAVSFNHQFITKRLGLRKALYFGLLFNIFGLLALWISHAAGEWSGSFLFIFFNMVFFGTALTSVINPLITYIVLEFPKKIGSGITALFAVFNTGVMLAPIFQQSVKDLANGYAIYPILLAFLILSIWFVHLFFFDRVYPLHLEHLRKGSKLWKELHYRLGLFVTAIIGYGIAETTFSLWGFVELSQQLGASIASETITFFWLFLVIGQVVLLLPLYFLPAKRIFYFLIFIIIIALYRFPYHTTIAGFIGDLVLAGFGCSAVFPILISMMEKELVPFAKGNRILPFIESATSVMIGGYFIGVGLIDLWVVKMGSEPWKEPIYFQLAIFSISLTGLIGFFLNLTAQARKSKV